MKSYLLKTKCLSVLLVAILFASITSCKKDSTTPDPDPEIPRISGIVTDEESGLALEGVLVTVNSFTATTNEKGEFFFYEAIEFTSIKLQKEGYVSLSREIENTEFKSASEEKIMAYTMFKKRGSTKVASGAAAMLTETSGTEQITLDVKKGSTSQDADISVTPVLGGGIPVLLEGDFLVVAAAHIEPVGLELSTPAVLSLPLDVKNTDNIQVRVFFNGQYVDITDFSFTSGNKYIQIPLSVLGTVIVTSGAYRMGEAVEYSDGPYFTGTTAGCSSDGVSYTQTFVCEWGVPEKFGRYASSATGVTAEYSISRTAFCNRSECNSPQKEVSYTITGTEYSFEENIDEVWTVVGTIKVPRSIIWECSNAGDCHCGGEGN